MGYILEIGTGRVSNIYVVVPVDGKLKICCGSVYSFYEFEYPLSDRLTDTKWRQMMRIELQDNGQYADSPAYNMEDWTRGFQYCYRENA